MRAAARAARNAVVLALAALAFLRSVSPLAERAGRACRDLPISPNLRDSQMNNSLEVTSKASDLRRQFIPSKISGYGRLLAAAIAISFATGQAGAASINIVALGASNTFGKGVGTSAAWPAKLEAMLRAKGYDVTVANAGINGDTTSGMVRRLGSAVPDGARLVILDKAASNDRKGNVDTAANVAAITAQLNARGIKLVVIPGMHGWANNQLQPDGIHITEQGHIAVANHLLGPVVAAIGKR